MQARAEALEKEARFLKGEVLDLVHRALKVAEKRFGPDHPEAAKLSRMCQVLARRYAAEEQAALQAQSPVKPGAGEGGGTEAAAAWLR
eukprot:CAMPEP_0172157956 /NCGR_PEP_ID=MMETSP1050-20130122/4100_1 /TAXON_ID=233186 /ORGANISM="Cryptomonas curvata, Strain CCAP979/52" /LENGTH=87 /DNA_ID=CAMNT_0012827285 /DNA_START=1968 /DNA_END=2227 /DNA_ORIENTATION=-